MDVYEAINSRRTIRDFENRPIEPDIIEKILSAGLKAPTNDHMRSWEFVIVNDKDVRAELLQPILKSRPATKVDAGKAVQSWGMTDERQIGMYMEALPRQYAMLYNAGCLVLSFFRHGKAWLQPTSISSLNGFASIWCCIENMLIAAAAEGIFGVTRIPTGNEPEHIKSVVRHPDDYIMPCYLALGYPAKDAVVVVQTEVSEKTKIHTNHW